MIGHYRTKPSSFLLLATAALSAAAPRFGQAADENPRPPSQVASAIPLRKTLEVRRANGPVRIDGVLDERAWTEASVLDLPYEYFPGDNTPAPVRTECRVTFDEQNLYVGIHAFDPRPGEIRAHLADRDEVTSFQQDDHVGFQLDPFDDERRALQFRVNPLGVQADAIFSELDDIEDWAWDAIWTSAGRVTPDGYVVEVAIPFKQLRFPHSDSPLVWGFDVFRSYPRDVRHRLSASYTDRNRSCMLCQVNKLGGLTGIHSGRSLELDPTATAHRREERPDFPVGPFEKVGQTGEVGLTARFGVTPNLSLNAALNPDFSQVEADVAQLEVNTRFALFFEEKRPFFLEGIDFFSTPLQTVYTRTVADPQGGVKATGKFGRNAIGVFVTRDGVNNVLLPANQSSDIVPLDQRVWGGVIRYRRDVGRASSVGVIYAGREADGYHNHLAGADAFWRASDRDTLRLQLTRSDTVYPDVVVETHGQPKGTFQGSGLFADYVHQSRDFFWMASYEDLGPGYRADSGFVPRVDLRTAAGTLARVFRGQAGRWYSQINLQAIGQHTEDHVGRLTDQRIGAEVVYSGPKQTSLDATLSANKTYLQGATYDLTQIDVQGEIRPTGDLRIQFTGTLGDALDLANGRKGRGFKLGPELQLRLGRHLDLRVGHNLERVGVAAGRVFTANLTQGRFAYHLGTRAFARVILQYLDLHQNPALYASAVEERTRHLFSQLLFSYKVNPQTVAFLGYSDNAQAAGGLTLTRADRTFFAKVGYAWAP